MHILCTTVTVQLPGCRSLKEKRSRTRKFRERWGKVSNVAVIESANLDNSQLCTWAMVIVGDSRKRVDQRLAEIESELESDLDGRLVELTRQWL